MVAIAAMPEIDAERDDAVDPVLGLELRVDLHRQQQLHRGELRHPDAEPARARTRRSSRPETRRVGSASGGRGAAPCWGGVEHASSGARPILARASAAATCDRSGGVVVAVDEPGEGEPVGEARRARGRPGRPGMRPGDRRECCAAAASARGRERGVARVLHRGERMARRASAARTGSARASPARARDRRAGARSSAAVRPRGPRAASAPGSGRAAPPAARDDHAS